MALDRIDIENLKRSLNPTLSPAEKARGLWDAFNWTSIPQNNFSFEDIYDRLSRGTETDTDKRVLMGLYALACAAQDRVDHLARRCAMCCCMWHVTVNGHLMRSIFNNTSLHETELQEDYPSFLASIAFNNGRPLSYRFRTDLRLEFGAAEQPEPRLGLDPEPPRRRTPEPGVMDVPHCCAAQILHKWGCGDPDGYDIHMGVSDVEELFKRGWFNRLKPVQLAILQEYQIEEGLGEVLKANGWECLRDEVKNNKGQRTLSIWAYFRDVPDYYEDDDYYEDEEF